MRVLLIIYSHLPCALLCLCCFVYRIIHVLSELFRAQLNPEDLPQWSSILPIILGGPSVEPLLFIILGFPAGMGSQKGASDLVELIPLSVWRVSG